MSVLESAQALAFVLLVVFLAYISVILVPFLRRTPDPEGSQGGFTWHVFIPCRDEETVIGNSLATLRGQFPEAHVWIVDDASEDATAQTVHRASETDPMVHLVRRFLPDARSGKGDALNAAYRALDDWLPSGADRETVIVLVLDADGLMSENAFRQAAGPLAFGDPEVGAAQTAVWMSNVDDPALKTATGFGRVKQGFARYLILMQDMEFRTTIAAMQSLRRHTLTVGLGGNGQFTRLSALDTIARTSGQPWHGALLEDYELAIHVMLSGYKTVYMHDAHVSQEALPGLRRLLTQRTRWCHGGMQCSSYLPRIFESPYFSNIGAIESSYFLVQPFIQILGLVLWPTLFIAMVAQGSLTMGGLQAWLAASWFIIPLIVVTGIAPFALWGPVYRKQAVPDKSRLAGVLWGVGYWLYMYQNYVSVLRATYRLVTGRHGWAKTRRNNENDTQLLAKEA
ncbi:glycosyltransferase family 2 protein [Arthrobacter bambusae]|uniref:glycosyltransferase family 2 protein n=1 Tax=Arthrobacter bambusae TaxID=1338426 RepID=UPI002781B360|nr:glycosyltransferase family 2 protein [Arthrobacter bambusae]MDQ0029541.1 cellulose synthase/poly-beta-1,6-N-acetylglucosamine synthase-like glycosyltransferase [Arthrobacter bambusae]MDQ0097201.1 cellulose synthase/poly-beta-1,6-N-acetylglucosamine synthase-like glycosyltransferase [Arthrobacter bambusae]